MAKQPVPLNKMSKKNRRKVDALQRGSWNGVNPVSRVIPSGKVFKRSVIKHEARTIASKDGE